MIIERVQAPTSLPVTVPELLAQARIDDLAENELLERLIGVATAHVEHVIQRSLLRQRWRIMLDEFPSGGLIRLPRSPVVEITSVHYVNRSYSDTLLPPSAYRLIGGDGLIPRLVPAVGQDWPKAAEARAVVVIDYLAGHEKPMQVDQDIRHAILMLAAHLANHREAVLSMPDMIPVPLGFDALLSRHAAPWVT